MKVNILSKRNAKEIIRDPVSIIFGIGLPVLLLCLMSTIQKKAAVDIFKIEYFAPAMAVFSYSFIYMFLGTLISKDRGSSFLNRLFSSPATASDYILGYSIPFIPIGILQSLACFTTAIFFGLEINVNLFITIIAMIPVSILFISFGLILGSLLSDKQVPPIASIIIQIVALSSGMWFDLSLIGGMVEKICRALPFAHAIDLSRYAMSGSYKNMLVELIWVVGYTFVMYILGVYIFKNKMKS